MSDTAFLLKNKILRFLYVYLLKPIFFAFDPEDVHNFMTGVGKFLGRFRFTRNMTELIFNYTNSALEQNIAGIEFKNPIGLAAGFDKDANLTKILPEVGFGFMEVGSITGNPCKGNPRPRLWRLKNSKGLVVYYGLKNEGCEKISAKLAKEKFKIPVGTSVAMTNCKENQDIKTAVEDYKKAFQAFTEIGAYTTVNVSCPNASGGMPFMNPENLEFLLAEIDKVQNKKLVFLKISPNVSEETLDKIAEISRRHKVNGFIVTNLTKDRNNKKIIDENLPEKGGISGKPLEDLANKAIEYLYRKYGRDFVIIGCGGIFSAEDAYKKIKLGASLIQMITGMIFEGPQTIGSINQGLVELLKKDGFTNISQAIGASAEQKTQGFINNS